MQTISYDKSKKRLMINRGIIVNLDKAMIKKADVFFAEVLTKITSEQKTKHKQTMQKRIDILKAEKDSL